MMKWMSIGAGSIIGGMLGWNIGHRFFEPTTSTVLAFLFSMLGTWIGWKLAQEA